MIALLFAAALAAQTLTLSGPSTVAPRSDVTIVVSSSITGAAGLQWSIGAGAGTLKSAAVSPSLPAAHQIYTNSSLSAAIIATRVNPVAAMPTGEIARYVVTAPETGVLTITLANIVAASPSATAIPLSATSAALTIQVGGAPPSNPSDIDGNGIVNDADVTAMILQCFAALLSTTPAADPNADGKTDVQDVIYVVRHMTSGTTAIGPAAISPSVIKPTAIGPTAIAPSRRR